jgi:uncharacterized protein YecE (DUF72 family)
VTRDVDEALRRAMELADRAPQRALSGNVACGTAGWTDASLVKSGLFYPKGATSAEARLRHYAEHFAVVEVDATYYSLLPPSVSERWLGWTPADFRFDVKAHPVLTGHPIDVARLPKDLAAALASAGFAERRGYADRMPPEIALEMERRFFDFVEPLERGARLGCVMLQLPPWARATRGNVRRLEGIRARYPEAPFSVEFRHPSWLEPARRDRVLAVLRDLRMSYVAVDEPNVAGGGVPPVTAVTNEALALVRFHGHNDAGWHRGASVAERFDYLYSEPELAAWAGPVREMGEGAARVHAIFNNCVRNYAVVGAKGLAVLLEPDQENGSPPARPDASADEPENP